MSLISNGLQLAGNVLRANLFSRVVSPRLISTSVVQCSNKKEVDPSKRRDREIPVETSIRYLESNAYNEAYQGHPVWKFYRRNYRGPFPPKRTRKTCIRAGVIATGSPCPICRDEYLIVDYRNINLLKQFISEQTGSVLDPSHTGVCRKQHRNLLVAIYKAQSLGLLTFDVPIVRYNYSDWYKPESEEVKGTAQTTTEKTESAAA